MPIRGDGNRAYITNVYETQARNSKKIFIDGIKEGVYQERGCNLLLVYLDKIKAGYLYADEPELNW